MLSNRAPPEREGLLKAPGLLGCSLPTLEPRRDTGLHVSEIPVEVLHRVLDNFELSSDEYNVGIDQSPTIRVRFDYPLNNPIIAEFRQPQGWLFGDFIVAVANKYGEIYAEEKATTSIPVGQASAFLINRNETDGKYGIWGHDIEDLRLTGVSKGEDGVYELDIES
jgi:hypothetical protein